MLAGLQTRLRHFVVAVRICQVEDHVDGWVRHDAVEAAPRAVQPMVGSKLRETCRIAVGDGDKFEVDKNGVSKKADPESKPSTPRGGRAQGHLVRLGSQPGIECFTAERRLRQKGTISVASVRCCGAAVLDLTSDWSPGSLRRSAAWSSLRSRSAASW